ncbi:hypothetical protein EVJ58_g4367 [Rhodofomes roseus]|uniref:Uncharacterized protein n=1 Tax=Rhodofomes roseus TaxID=34475 RepID=A0A4Y9YGI6_9APHY|nr:hypothetical protein EVJ58_g4367 [Rhodofomes roseus]
MLADDLPWPELGNVSRGATRGNQGQKGVLGPTDAEGRCVLQLRVQPGVLAVRLNRQASDWYRTLDGEVTRALKLTKTYWRKARRRQDYDARADQDHMELHEWLQQLKDKVMSHLELLMQKGEIQGPPYVMPDHLELTFLRKFIERQVAGIPHNPRLRRTFLHTSTGEQEQSALRLQHPTASTSAIASGSGWQTADDEDEHDDAGASPGSGATDDTQTVMQDLEIARNLLGNARAELARARKNSQEALAAYTTCLDAEDRARQQVLAAEQRRDHLVSRLMNSYPGEAGEGRPIVSPKSAIGECCYATTTAIQTKYKRLPREWYEPHSLAGTSREHGMQIDPMGADRKHPRSWEPLPGRDVFEDMASLPPMKRQQLSGSAMQSTSSLTSSFRQTGMPMAVTDPQRVDHNVSFMPNAQQGGHLGNM